MLDRSIFRTYDIRGIVGTQLTAENIFLIGKGIGSLLKERNEHSIIVARDGRLSSPLLIEHLTNGILSTGCDVIDIGLAPTPLLYFATHVLAPNSGVMLTGSHNPGNYNGLKIVLQQVALSEDEIKDLYQRIIEENFCAGQGVLQFIDIESQYMEATKKDVQLTRTLSVVIDAGNGVTGHLAPKLFRHLGCTVNELFCDIDGTFPNHHPDPSQPEHLQDLICMVKEKGADVGIAFDGDGDRIGIVTNKGSMISSDRLLMLFARSILSEHPQSTIIFDVKCTNNLVTLINELGGTSIMWKTGHSLIKAKMVETNALLGGEVSGHVFFKDRWYGFDDALYAGARLLEILSKTEKSSEEIFATIPNSIITPELKVSVSDEEKFRLMDRLIAHANFDDAKDINNIDGLRVSFAEGWGLVRPSNTTPYLILRFEALNETILEQIQSVFRQWMLSVQPNLELPF